MEDDAVDHHPPLPDSPPAVKINYQGWTTTTTGWLLAGLSLSVGIRRDAPWPAARQRFSVCGRCDLGNWVPLGTDDRQDLGVRSQPLKASSGTVSTLGELAILT